MPTQPIQNQNLGGYQGTGQTGNFNGVQYNAANAQNPYGSYTIPTTPAVSTTTPTNNIDIPSGSYESPETTAARNAQSSYLNSLQQPDEDAIYKKTLGQFQAQIDAVNAMYADEVAKAKVQGTGRLGTQTAMSARRGLIGSDFGEANFRNQEGENNKVIQGIENEKMAKVAFLLGQAKTDASDRLKAQREEFTKGLDARLAFYADADSRKAENASKAAKALIAQGLNPKDVDKTQLGQLAKYYGISTDDIMAGYDEAKKLKDESDILATRAGQFNLSEGQARYDSKGNMIASRGKTYAPKSGGEGGVGIGGYSGKISSGALALAQQIQNGTATLAQVPSKLRAEVAQALNQLPNPRVQEIDDIINTIKELGGNTKLDNILGPADQFVGGVFGKAATAKNLYKQLIGILSLEGRSKLKGSGAISDFEFRVLKEAQSALGRNLNKTEFIKQLDKVKKVLDNRKNVLKSQNTSYQEDVEPQKTIEDYKLEFPEATEEELQALLEEEQGN